ncbi:MAG: alpha/beta hydrolase [Tetrasphaera sp.]
MRTTVVRSLGVAAVVGVAGAATAAVRAASSKRRALDGIDAIEVQDEKPFSWAADRVETVRTSDGVELHVEIDEPEGHDSRPSVIFSHGYCLTAASWIHQRRALVAAGYRCVLWDQRGHGQSGHGNPDNSTVDQLGLDLAAVIERTCPTGPIALVGHSMGGMTIMALALERPELVAERVCATALVATSAGGKGLVTTGFGAVLGGVLHRYGPRVLVGLSAQRGLWQRARGMARDVESLFVERFSFSSPVSEETVRFCADMLMGTDLQVVGAFLGSLEKHDKTAALEAFAGMPVLVVNGEEDVMTPPEDSAAIVAALPGAEHLLVTDAGHLVMLEHPSLVNLHLLSFLDRAGESVRETVSTPRKRERVTDLRRRHVVAEIAGGRARRGARKSRAEESQP